MCSNQFLKQFVWAICLLMLMSSCSLFRPVTTKELAVDSNAQKNISAGINYMQQKRYAQAAILFDQAKNRPLNQGTTVAHYLAGLTRYYAGQPEKAKQDFQVLINQYGQSKYVPEAKYHLALIKIKSGIKSDQYDGFDILTSLINQKENEGLAFDAENTFQKFLFEEVSIEFLDEYLYLVPNDQKIYVVEALVMKKLQAEEREAAQRIYNNFIKENLSPSEFLESLLGNSDNKIDQSNRKVYRVALFLPLSLNHPTNVFDASISQLPSFEQTKLEQSRVALNFYEGLELALKDYNEQAEEKIYLKLLDTEQDTFRTRLLLDQLTSYKPDLIIGAMNIEDTKILSDWAEANEVPLMVPRWPFSDIVEGKNHTFLAHPSVKTQGAQMANYAYQYLNLKNVLIWIDDSEITRDLAAGFTESFQFIGGNVEMVIIPDLDDHDNTREALQEIRSLVNKYNNQGFNTQDADLQLFDGWYFPFTTNQPAASLILTELVNYGYDTQLTIMGSPQWYTTYDKIERGIKENTGLYFTTSYLIEESTPSYLAFYNSYLDEYKIPPAIPPNSDKLNFEGYDFGNYLIQLFENYQFQDQSLTEFIHTLPEVEGIHINYYFGGTQINQAVNIGQFTIEGVIEHEYDPSYNKNSGIWPDPNPRY